MSQALAKAAAALPARRDTAKCAGEDCPIRKHCKRYLRPAAENQTWAGFRYDKKEGCEYFQELV
jgi:hypothetical protein